MKTLLSNYSGTLFGWFCGRFPDLIGNLFSIDGKFTPWKFATYALDNGAYPAWKNSTPWDEAAWLKLLDRAARCPMHPEWVLVPDVVTEKTATLESYERYLPEVLSRGLIPAFAAQDGMVVDDVPKSAEVVFIGGSTDWKWSSLPMWCSSFPRIHVGRVNYITQLMKCYEQGVESTDGTGWFRGSDDQVNGLLQFCELVANESDRNRQGGSDLRKRDNCTLSLFKYRDSSSNPSKTEQLRMF